MHRPLSLFITLSLLSPQVASARFADDVIQVREATNQRSEVQREEQRARRRAFENRPTELDARLRQRKPRIQERKVSQRERRNLQLQASAQAYAQDMKTRDFFSHESPEGETPQQRIQRGGYGNITAQNCDCRSFTAAFGENLARGQQTVEDVMQDWMESPTHRANMLSERFNEIGIGIEGTYWVQHFGAVETVPR